MAHTFGTTILARSSSAGNPITRAATTVATDSVIVLSITTVSATNRAGGSPTWNGVAGLQAWPLQKASVSPEASIEMWAWVNSVSLFIGSANLVVPNTGALTIHTALYSGRAGADKLSAYDGANGTNATSANPTTNSIGASVNGNIFFGFTAGGWQTFAPSARTGTSLYETDDGATGGGGQYLLQGTAASQALSWTFATSDDWGAIGASFKEIDPPSVVELLPRKRRRYWFFNSLRR